MSILDLFGGANELLRDASGVEADLNTLVKENDWQVVGLYFSAFWCPPCRAFTPQLAEWYKNFKGTSPNKDNFEIVFISSDRTEESFKDYFNQMPWLALPYSSRDLKDKLSKDFKVVKIPTLIMVDGKTGKLITKEGRGIVGDDTEGKEFPWPQKMPLDVLPGPLLTKEDKEIEWSDVTEEIIGLYFSAQWCGPCRSFTPQLIETYQRIREEGNSFQIIFVSSDRYDESFKEYYGTMPWLALPFGDSRNTSLSKVFNVSGIPALTMMKKTGEIITTKGRIAASMDPLGNDYPWYPKPVNSLNNLNAGNINDCPCIIQFMKSSEEKIQVIESLESIAVPYIESKPEETLSFYYLVEEEDEDGVGSGLREYANMPDDHNLLCIDAPNDRVYSAATDGDKANARTIFEKFTANLLEMRSI